MIWGVRALPLWKGSADLPFKRTQLIQLGQLKDRAWLDVDAQDHSGTIVC